MLWRFIGSNACHSSLRIFFDYKLLGNYDTVWITLINLLFLFRSLRSSFLPCCVRQTLPLLFLLLLPPHPSTRPLSPECLPTHYSTGYLNVPPAPISRLQWPPLRANAKNRSRALTIQKHPTRSILQIPPWISSSTILYVYTLHTKHPTTVFEINSSVGKRFLLIFLYCYNCNNIYTYV